MSLPPPQNEINRIVSRNAACPCNSGLRYKHCCGLADNSAAPAAARDKHERKRNAGLMLQQRGDFSQAIEAYDAILHEHREDWDVAHMRATCLYQLAAMDDACVAFAALLDAPFPTRFIARENRGAAATLNQGIELAKGEFIQSHTGT